MRLAAAANLGRLNRLAAGLAPFVVLTALAFADGGYFPRAWIAGGIGFAALAALAAVARGRVDVTGRESAFVAALAAVAVWIGLSAIWSDDPSASLREGGRAALYVAAAAAFVQLAPAALASGVLAAIGVVCAYGVAERLLVDPLALDPAQGGVLFEPVGYANAIGALAAMGLLLSCGLAVRRPALAAATATVLAAALVLSASRGAAIALGAGLALAVALERRLGATAILLAPGAAAAAALAWLWRPPVVPGDLAGASAGDVRLLAGALVVVAAVSGFAAARVRIPERAGRIALAALAAAAVLALIAVAAGFSPGLGNRPDYWSVAWDEYRANPVLGSGAGTFERYWIAALPESELVLDAHSLYVETLAELGPAGLGLVVAALALPLLAIGAVRGPLAAAAAGAYAVFLVHAGLDWDWELPAVTVAGLACGATLLGHAARDERYRRHVGQCSIRNEEERL